MKRIKWLYGAIATLGLVASAHAAEPDYRWYIAPSVGGIFSGTGAGPQINVTGGRDILPNFGVEAEFGFGSQSVDKLPSGSDYERMTFGLNALGYLPLGSQSVRPYLLLNGNVHSIDFLGESLTGMGVGFGGGTFVALTKSLDLRADVRYNLDFISAKGAVSKQTFNVGTGTVGIRYKFGADPDDSDGDGVPNDKDKCPDTPRGVKVYSDGCPTDLDGDGVPDYLDKCPNSPKDIPVGKDGCPLDSDGDGIPDYLDECPNTPPGLKVLPNGCALKGDCRRPRPGEAVDAKGCALDQRFILRGVKFEFDSDRLTAPSKEILAEVAVTLASYPDVKVDVEGHTDDVGTDAYNLGLSERRSIAVKKFLIDKGVNGANLKPVGYGESVPIDNNATEPGRENNRRVEFKVTN